MGAHFISSTLVKCEAPAHYEDGVTADVSNPMACSISSLTLSSSMHRGRRWRAYSQGWATRRVVR